MKQWKKRLVLGGLVLAAAAMTGCMGYGSYGGYSGYSNRVPKTTAAKETLEEFDVGSLRTEEGVFQYQTLQWGATREEVGNYMGVTLDEGVTFSDGSSYNDANYSILLKDKVSLGMMPTFDVDGGLSCMSFYFENIYTAEELDAFYEEVVDACITEFGEPHAVRDQVDESNGTEYSSVTAMWYYEIDDTHTTSLQVGKLDSGRGTDAVVLGVNIYDPALILEETTSQENSEESTEE